MSNNPEPRRPAQPSPEIEPARGSPEKRFPENPEPLAGRTAQKVNSAAEEPTDETPSRLGSGEDPGVESGVDKDDPEQSAATGDIDKSFE